MNELIFKILGILYFIGIFISMIYLSKKEVNKIKNAEEAIKVTYDYFNEEKIIEIMLWSFTWPVIIMYFTFTYPIRYVFKNK